MYVYVVTEKGSRDYPVKIGRCNSPARRLSELQTGHHSELCIKHIIKCKSAKSAANVEYGLHKLFARHRLKGEWFEREVLGQLRKVLPNYAEVMVPKIGISEGSCWSVRA